MTGTVGTYSVSRIGVHGIVGGIDREGWRRRWHHRGKFRLALNENDHSGPCIGVYAHRKAGEQ